ncbi:MAG: antitoxin [Deltaproteobacteria bacterium]|nr:antitoxin [Deltaproteobacteria bacterium]
MKEAERIRNELNQIERMALHVERDWQKFITLGDDAYLKAVAYDLHGFYTGLERIFHSVADTIDDHVPGGESWHRDLLEQMGKEMKGLRPALLSRETVTLLDEFLRFRHRIRNIYSFNLVPERIKVLVEKLPGVYKQVKSNLTDFSHFLERFFVTAKEA